MIDLHAHTTISDGSKSPTELIQIAEHIGLSAVAITDHDSIEGHDEAQREADRLGIRLIKGVEFSVAFGENRLIHILGLGIEQQCDEFMSIYNTFRRKRSEKLDHVFEKLQARGVEISRQKVEKHMTGEHMDRQAIAKYLYCNGYASDIIGAWVNYLDYINYTEGELLTPEEAFAAIHAAGGKAFLAHFHLHIGLKGYSFEESYNRLEQLKELGLDGMEFYYPSFTDKDKNRCEHFIQELDFLKSGGTDFHGSNRPHIDLGVGQGDFSVPDELLEGILQKALV